MSQAYDSKKSLDITRFSRDQQNKSVEEYAIVVGVLAKIIKWRKKSN